MRHPTLGAIDRSRPLRFTFDGVDYPGYAGDTLASALLANGVHRVATSVNLGRPRGIVAAGPEEPSAVIQVVEPFPEPMLTATTVELTDGLVATSLPGQGWLAPDPDPSRNDAVWAHCETLVVGGGPSGLAAARAAEGRVMLVTSRPHAGEHGVRVLERTTAVGYYDDNLVVAVQRLGARTRERLWRIRARRVVLATGAHERPLLFPDNDRPGVMLAHSALEYAERYGVLVGRRALVYTNNSAGVDAASGLARAGLEIVAVADARHGEHIAEVSGEERVTGVSLRDGRSFDVDVVLVSGGFSPVLHLYSQAGGRLRYDEALGAHRPDGCRQAVEIVGAATGEGLPRTGPVELPVPSSGDARTFVDLQRDVTVADVRRATRAGLRSVEHVKRYTTAGTAHDQGKTSGVVTSAVVADALGVAPAVVGLTTFRPPYVPVAFATFAGRERGELFDPARLTAIHDWHCAHGAVFENVGQWKRARYYPREGEDMDAAVARESRAARTGVAMMDASTLGKIEVYGPDAGEFLDRLYTNVMSTLAVGAVRYGVLCRADGMVFDDGTVARLAPDRFLVTTTTGNAAAVLEWMEEWRQTEWPTLAVWCTSVTEQWATVALVGPLARRVMDRVSTCADLKFMRWRDDEVCALPARVSRISFSGELAYEVNVAWWHGLALWEALCGAGDPVPYGTETMHVLRAEKGYPIIGQDTDGTQTPDDLGLGWAVRQGPKDFVGRRSLSRVDNRRRDRKQLVGLVPADPSLVLAEGAHVVESPGLGSPPVPYLGHVTSSYRSVTLGRSFALGLVAGGRDRIGTTVYATLDGAVFPVEVTSPVLYDPEGARRDG
jgi:sarcosine oxidase, subunit alpha